MDNKDLITRFAEDCFRFEALQQEIDSLIADADSEVLAYEYEGLANQAAEIVLKLSANGNNLGHNFYRYYVERLEYIIDYFRALLDYEETPLAEDEPNELDDEPAAETHFEGFPAGCVFPLPPPFVYKKWELQFPPMTKDEANAATDEAGAVEEDEQSDEGDSENDAQAAESDEAGAVKEDDSEDEQPDEVDNENDVQAAESDEAGAVKEDDSEDEQSDEVDNENDTQAAESDEAADGTAAGAPLPTGEKPCTSSKSLGLEELPSEDIVRVRDTLEMWFEMNVITGRYGGDGKRLPAADILRRCRGYFNAFNDAISFGNGTNILAGEVEVRRIIWKAIDAIPRFRDSVEFEELIEQYPTYNEIVEL